MQAVYPTIAAAGGGVVVNLGSGSGTGGQARFGAYAAAKEAVRGMSKAAALEWVPLRRVGRTSEDIGTVVAFLVSDEAEYLTGQTIHVDGGMGVFR
jgi:NAD(P)-dependent dehydrogenase (short-subunit alcohol dehydrogenase family)